MAPLPPKEVKIHKFCKIERQTMGTPYHRSRVVLLSAVAVGAAI